MNTKRAHIPLSYSRLSDYETCPRKFKAKYISKTYPDDSGNPAFAKGNKIHKDLEMAGKAMAGQQHVKQTLSEEAKNALPMLKQIVQSFDTLMFEQQIAVDKQFKRSSWFDNNSAYFRVIADLLAIRQSQGLIVDWKSGKVRDYDDKPTGQLHLSSAVIMKINPRIEKVDNAYVFVEHGQVIKRTFTSDQTDSLLEPFEEMYDVICSDTVWEPRKNAYCYNCHVVGCEYNS